MKQRILMLFTAAFLGAAAHADEACKAEIEKFCSKEKEGTPRMGKCLKERLPELSEDCKISLGVRRQAFKKLRKACRKDIKTHCKDVKGKAPAKLACLQENIDKLSADCRAALPSVEQANENAVGKPDDGKPANDKAGNGKQ